MLPIPYPVTIGSRFPALRWSPVIRRYSRSAGLRSFSGGRHALDGKQAMLCAESTRVAANRGVRANYAVAGHDHWDWVSAEGITNRARRPGFTDLARDTRVGIDVAERHRCCRLEDRTLKGGHAPPVERNVEPRALAAEILSQLRRGTPQDHLNLGRRVLNALQPHRVQAALSLPLHECGIRHLRSELDLPQTFGCRRQDELPDRAVDPRVPDPLSSRQRDGRRLVWLRLDHPDGGQGIAQTVVTSQLVRAIVAIVGMLEQPADVVFREITDNTSRHRLTRHVAGIDVRLAGRLFESINRQWRSMLGRSRHRIHPSPMRVGHQIRSPNRSRSFRSASCTLRRAASSEQPSVAAISG